MHGLQFDKYLAVKTTNSRCVTDVDLFCGETTRSQSTLTLKTYKQLLNHASESLQPRKTAGTTFTTQNTTVGN